MSFRSKFGLGSFVASIWYFCRRTLWDFLQNRVRMPSEDDTQDKEVLVLKKRVCDS